MRERFNARVTAADVARCKPDPEMYIKAASAPGVAPTGCLVVEDAVLRDRATLAAGARCLALTTTFPCDVLLQARAECVTAHHDPRGGLGYDTRHAAAFAGMGIPTLACMLDQLPGLMTAALQRQDLAQWAARENLVLARPG
ncbi:HAD-IA family hydrolase [Archangium lansingense]|uniref:HAD family phosphatase n=1 Tax=Archangium lansingense TaxID=2995310 RepID=A0ABT4AGC4_9BACT|nr:HAD family phosphatase [Archangium lansinium]MCY1080636.1 HAD family phosphatase [Archangium lansinium]